jgi:hypothetical protein
MKASDHKKADKVAGLSMFAIFRWNMRDCKEGNILYVCATDIAVNILSGCSISLGVCTGMTVNLS